MIRQVLRLPRRNDSPWVLALVLGLSVVPARAQTPLPTPPPTSPFPTGPAPATPLPSPSPSPSPSPGEDQQGKNAPVTTTARASTTSRYVTVGLYGNYNSNVDFTAPDDPGDFASSGRLSVGISKRTSRGSFGLSLNGGGYLYRELQDADSWDASVNIHGSRQLSSRTTLNLGAYGSYETTDVSRALIEIGLQLPRTPTLHYGGNLGLETRIGAETSLSLATSYSQVNFDSADLVDSQYVFGSLALSRRLGTKSSIWLGYSYSRDFDPNQDSDNQVASLGWSRRLSRRFVFNVAGGAGYATASATGEGSTAPPVAAEDRWYTYGSGSLVGTFHRTSLTLQARQSINPAFGLGGLVLSDAASLSLSVPFGRQGQFSIGGGRTWSEDPQSKSSAYVSDDATASLSIPVLRRLWLSLNYSFRRSEPTGGEVVMSHSGSFGLTYTYFR